MRLATMLLLLVLALTAAGALLGLGSAGVASNGSTIFVPWVMKEATMEEVAIVQRDGYKAVYWPSPVPTPGWPDAPLSGIPIYLEVENRTSRNVTGVTVDFRASDAAGNLITQTITQTSTLLDILRPGQRSPVAFNIPFPGGYSAFQASKPDFTLLPNWSHTDLDSQDGLEVGWSSLWQPPPPYPTPTPYVPAPPHIYGWVKNNGSSTASGVSVVVTIRGNEGVQGLILEAAEVPIYLTLYPEIVASFYANFSRDYGPLFGRVEAVAQRRLDIPGILRATSW